MWVDDVVSHLEMTGPDRLVPPRGTAVELPLREVGVDDLALVRDLHDWVAGPYGWQSLSWTTDRWRECLTRPGVRTWLPVVAGREAGLALLQSQPGGHVEIDFFGLTPDHVGRGLGGPFLAEVTRRAWGMAPVDAPAVRRVWLRTSSHDHPHARAAYEARGYRLVHTELRRRKLVPARAR
jgi:GNAT superfamily N-acetyltransferase